MERFENGEILTREELAEIEKIFKKIKEIEGDEIYK